MIRFLRIPLFVVASLLAITACNSKSSSNAAEQSSATTSTAGATAAAPSPTASSPTTVYGVPVFPGATVVPPSTINMSSDPNTTVLSAYDRFDEVRAWYDARNPGVPQTRVGGAMTSVVFTLGTGKDKVTVTVSDTPDRQHSIITYVRGKM